MSKYHDIKVNKVNKYKTKEHKEHFEDKWEQTKEVFEKALADKVKEDLDKNNETDCTKGFVIDSKAEDLSIELNVIQRDYRDRNNK